MTIRLQPDGFSILLPNEDVPQWHSVAPGADFEKRMEETMLDAKIAEYEADEVLCIVGTNRISLSPVSSSAEEAEAMFALSMSKPAVEEVLLTSEMQEAELRLTYGLQAQLYHFIQRTLPDATFVHPLCLQHEANFEAAAAHAQCMVIEAIHASVNMLAYIDGKLVLGNSIHTSSINNQAYFILSAWNQLGFDTLTDSMILAEASNELRELLSTYIKCVS